MISLQTSHAKPSKLPLNRSWKRPYEVDRDMQNVKTKINISNMKETFTSGVA